jgi:hypothetical protein
MWNRSGIRERRNVYSSRTRQLTYGGSEFSSMEHLRSSTASPASAAVRSYAKSFKTKDECLCLGLENNISSSIISRIPVEADTLRDQSLGTDIASGWHKWKAFRVKISLARKRAATVEEPYVPMSTWKSSWCRRQFEARHQYPINQCRMPQNPLTNSNEINLIHVCKVK